MKKNTRRSSLAALRLALAFLVPASGAAAATFTVTNLADSGPGSLRQAVLSANASAGADEVAFAPGLAGTITLTSGQIVISDPLVVHGPGSGVLTVSGADQFRIFAVEDTAVAPIAVTLSGLTLTRGRGLPVFTVAFGGAVFASGEDLTILDSVISDSTAGLQMDPPNGGCGGNVAFDGLNAATLRIVNSRLTGGSVVGFGGESGGNLCVVNGRLVLERSTLSGGSADSGGGLFAASLMEDSLILLSTVSGNNAGSFGGGIYTDSFETLGDLTIESSTISGNTVTPAFGSGGGLSIGRGNVRILNSTISGNDAGLGGGINNQDGNLQIINSTVSGNHAQFVGGGIQFSEFGNGSLLLRLTTISENSADTSGGSLAVGSPSTADVVQLDHSIAANGTPQDLAGFGALPTLTANYSLIEAPGTMLLVGANNVIGVDPLLAPLANYGGLTLTHRLLPGSLALDAGNPAIPSPPATDQRGAARIAGPAIDMGSVEGLGLAEVPALSQLGLALLGILILAAGVRRLRG